MPRSRPRLSSPLILLVGVVTLGLAPGACLPTGLAPTGSPPPATPTPSPAPPTPTPTPGPPTPTPAPTFLVHVVARGESLTSIARRYRTTARSVAFWNRATYPTLDPTSPRYAPDRIAVGWPLRVLPRAVYDESAETDPPPSDRATPVPSLAIPPAPAPPAGRAIVVSAGGRGGNAISLTVELGGRTSPDDAVVAWLVEHDVPATIFVTGEAAATDAGRRALALVASHPGLLTLGDLTWIDRSLVGLTSNQVRDQLARAERVLHEATGLTSKPFARPPFGVQDATVRDAFGKAGFGYVVLWDVDPSDWKREAAGGPTADDIVSRVVSRAQGGSIVVLHAGGESTLAALPGIVGGLAGARLQPVTLDRLLGVDRPAG